jgi:hypothetical protein
VKFNRVLLLEVFGNRRVQLIVDRLKRDVHSPGPPLYLSELTVRDADGEDRLIGSARARWSPRKLRQARCFVGEVRRVDSGTKLKVCPPSVERQTNTTGGAPDPKLPRYVMSKHGGL